MKKSGIELITEERDKQIGKYGFTGEHHVNHPEWYDEDQLIHAAIVLTNNGMSDQFIKDSLPKNWNLEWFTRLCKKPLIDRLKISGALIASEIDRLQQK